MGKISEALKKLNEEKEKQKKEIVEKRMWEKKEEEKKEERKTTQTFFSSWEQRLRFKEKFFLLPSQNSLGVDPRIVTYYDDYSPLSEQYRLLRTNVKSLVKKIKGNHKLIKGEEPAIITFSSSLRGEGKTITIVNLAMSLASEEETKVLLIDGDLRNGTIHKLLNVGEEPGLSTILMEEYDWSVGLHPTSSKNLFVIPRGKISAHPCEFLGSRKMRMILERLRREKFNYILMDTPPLLSFADAQLIAQLSDGIIIVVEASHTKAEVVKKAKEICEQAHTKILGFVLTKVDYYTRDNYYYYYNYQDYGRKI